MSQNYFSLEVDVHSYNPIIGSLNERTLDQFINTFIMKDNKLLYFEKNKE